MARHRVAPVVLNVGMATTFTASLSATSLFSTGVHQNGDTAYSMLACAALVLIVSQGVYYVLTLLQLLYARALQQARARRPDAKRDERARALSDERDQEPSNAAVFTYFLQTCTVSEVLFNTIDFQHKREEIRLWVSREDLWHVFYLFAPGVYGCFLALPTYDPMCTMCFALGIFASSMHSETQRGRLWKRPAGRKVLLGFVFVFGVVALTLTLALGYYAMLKTTNRAFARVQSAHAIHTHVQHALLNSSELLADVVHAHDNGSWAHEMLHSEVIAQLTDTGPHVSRDDEQFLAWFVHAYPLRTWPWWVFCLYTPFLLAQMPDSLRLPVLLETAQVPTTCAALAVLAHASLAADASVLDFVSVQSALGNLYLFGGSTCTWLGVFSACFLLRQRTALVLTAPLLLVCFAKGAHMLNDELWRRETMPLVALTGVAAALYTLLLAYFCRLESVAVRGGWGRHRGSAEGDETGVDSDDERMCEPGAGTFCVQDDTEHARAAETEHRAPVLLRSSILHAVAVEAPAPERARDADSPRSRGSGASGGSAGTAETAVRAAV